MVKLDILSDPVCPWCYIGKAELDRALARARDNPFTVGWHPFRLNPDMPARGMDRRAYLEAKFGGAAAAEQAYARIAERSAAAGLAPDFDAIARTPDTLDAHRLIHWAGLERRQQAVVAALFAAYFEAGRDIGNRVVLADIAEESGMDRAESERLLATDADADSIRARDAHARERGVGGVPTFIVAETHVVTGAQPSELWDEVIAELGALAAPARGRA